MAGRDDNRRGGGRSSNTKGATRARIAEVLGAFGEPYETSVWEVQGTPVIYHRALERISSKAGVSFQPPVIVRAEPHEAVLLVTGERAVEGSRKVEWSFGEARVIRMVPEPFGRQRDDGKGPFMVPEWTGDPADFKLRWNAVGNYIVTGAQAAYPYAMAEKRGKDRVILKLIELHGLVYSEEEADDFKQSGDRQTDSMGVEYAALVAKHRQALAAAGDAEAVLVHMQDEETQADLALLPEGLRNTLRVAGRDRLVELGWEPPSRQVEKPPAQAALPPPGDASEALTGLRTGRTLSDPEGDSAHSDIARRATSPASLTQAEDARLEMFISHLEAISTSDEVDTMRKALAASGPELAAAFDMAAGKRKQAIVMAGVPPEGGSPTHTVETFGAALARCQTVEDVQGLRNDTNWRAVAAAGQEAKNRMLEMIAEREKAIQAAQAAPPAGEQSPAGAQTPASNKAALAKGLRAQKTPDALKAYWNDHIAGLDDVALPAKDFEELKGIAEQRKRLMEAQAKGGTR